MISFSIQCPMLISIQYMPYQNQKCMNMKLYSIFTSIIFFCGLILYKLLFCIYYHICIATQVDCFLFLFLIIDNFQGNNKRDYIEAIKSLYIIMANCLKIDIFSSFNKRDYIKKQIKSLQTITAKCLKISIFFFF